jgi:uncharacterized protein
MKADQDWIDDPVSESGAPERAPAEGDPVVVPREALAPATLRALLVDFATRDGTDYGEVEATLERKISELEAQLVSGEIAITFDPLTETCNVVLRRELR